MAFEYWTSCVLLGGVPDSQKIVFGRMKGKGMGDSAISHKVIRLNADGSGCKAALNIEFVFP